MECADNVVFLATINHFFTKARLRDINEKGFYIQAIGLCDTPAEFPPSGFQLGAVHIGRERTDKILMFKVTSFVPKSMTLGGNNA
jgi:hypothetical protein